MQGFCSHSLIHTCDQVWSKSNQVWCGRKCRSSNIWPQNYANLTIVIIAFVQITLTLDDKWPRFKYILSVNENAKLIIQCSPQTHTVTHADKSHWNPKSFNLQIWETDYLHCSTRNVWVELNSQTETRNSHISTRNSNSHSQFELATCNSQLAEYLDPLIKKES